MAVALPDILRRTTRRLRSNDLTYMLPWESLADRETRWTAFENDPTLHEVRGESERDGPIVASISNQILVPTTFSTLK
jgi:hypothetical protein